MNIYPSDELLQGLKNERKKSLADIRYFQYVSDVSSFVENEENSKNRIANLLEEQLDNIERRIFEEENAAWCLHCQKVVKVESMHDEKMCIPCHMKSCKEAFWKGN